MWLITNSFRNHLITRITINIGLGVTLNKTSATSTPVSTALSTVIYLFWIFCKYFGNF